MTTRVLMEIEESSAVVERLLRSGQGAIDSAAAAIARRNPRFVVFTGRGCSFLAGLYGRYLVETLVGLPVVMAAQSVSSVYGRSTDLRDAVLIGLSQAGESPDTCSVVERARASGALTIAISNNPASTLARTAEIAIPLLAGPEAVVVSKSYVAELAVIATLVSTWSDHPGLASSLTRAPAALRSSFASASAWLDQTPEFVDDMAAHDRSIVVSRGYDLPTALDTALKLKEMGRVFAEGFSAADLPHGHIVTATSNVSFVAFRPNGPASASVDAAVHLAEQYGARPWIVGRRDTVPGRRTLVLDDDLPDELGPLPLIVAGHLIAERVARARGCDPDRPPGLVKVIRTT